MSITNLSPTHPYTRFRAGSPIGNPDGSVGGDLVR